MEIRMAKKYVTNAELLKKINGLHKKFNMLVNRIKSITLSEWLLFLVSLFMLGVSMYQTHITKDAYTALNRPYLMIETPNFELLDSKGNILPIKDDPRTNLQNVSTLRLVSIITNSGPIPAEIINLEYTIPEINVSFNKALQLSISKDHKQYHYIGDFNSTNGLSAFFTTTGVTIKFTVTYIIHGLKEEYTSVNVYTCGITNKGTQFTEITCSNDKTFTT